MRVEKGMRIESHLDDYTVIDIETCGLIGSLRNYVIELSAIRVREGQIIEEYSSLVNPGIPIPDEVVKLTGITNEMVADELSIDTVLPRFLSFVGDDIVVGFNINSFDYNIIYDLSEAILGKPFTNDFVDILYASQRTVPEMKKHSLEYMCNLFGVNDTGAHRALKDCYLTKQIYDMLWEKYGREAFDDSRHQVGQNDSSNKKTNFSLETIQLQELNEILSDIISDNTVTQEEVVSLALWMEKNNHLKGNYPYDRVFRLLERILEDCIIDRDELQLLFDIFQDYTNPAKTTCNDVAELRDKHFVITGEFTYGSRNDVEQYIASKGGIVDNTVKKTTDYVVIGSLGSQAWKNGNYGGKIKKAMELRDKGQAIELIGEEDFFSLGG
ncbi:MAG: hypothetical protein IKN14_04420 [Clostridiales bacterium]|nr:hypothetical protein [Clostridiales bacterium]